MTIFAVMTGAFYDYCAGVFPDMKSAQVFAEEAYPGTSIILAEQWKSPKIGVYDPPLDFSGLCDECGSKDCYCEPDRED